MRSELAAVDVGVVLLYVLGTFLLGAWFSRRQGSTRTYFVGDRDVSWWLVLASIVATETSTVTFLSVPGLAFDRDPHKANLTFLLLQQFTGWDPYASVLVMGAVTIAYTYLGGMQAVIWTDLVQLLIYLLGAVVAGALVLHVVAGGFGRDRPAG